MQLSVQIWGQSSKSVPYWIQVRGLNTLYEIQMMKLTRWINKEKNNDIRYIGGTNTNVNASVTDYLINLNV